MCPCSRHTHVYICVGTQPVPYLSLHTPMYSRRQPTARSKRGATFLLSLFVSLLFFLSSTPERCSRAGPPRARGIKYNKDIQWELIGYLPIYRSLSAYCCVVPPVQRRCRGPVPWRHAGACAPVSFLPSFSIPLFCSLAPLFLFFSFFHRRRPNRDIPWQNNIADHVFRGRNASPRPRYRCAASSSTGVFYPAPGECLTNPYPYASSATWLFPGSWNVARFDTLRRRRSIPVCEFISRHSRPASYN